VQADHGRIKARLRPMRGLETIRSLRTVAAGHAFMHNPRRRHYEFTVDLRAHDCETTISGHHVQQSFPQASFA
jgi:transposase, IS6 family